MHHRGAHVKNGMEYNCDTDFLTGGLLQVTFAPVWRQCKPKKDLKLPVTSHEGRKPSSALTAVSKTQPPNPTLNAFMVELDKSDTNFTESYIIQPSQLDFKTTKGGKFEQKFTAAEGSNEISMLIEDAAKILRMQDAGQIVHAEDLHDCGLTLDIGHHNTRCTGFHPSGGSASFTFEYGNNYQHTMTLFLHPSFFQAVQKKQQEHDAEMAKMRATSSSASIMPMSSSINKSGFLGQSAASTQATQPTPPTAHRGTSVSAQLSGLFGSEASAQDATTDDDARASKVPKKTSTETATPAAPEASGSSAAAKKTQAAQSIGQSMKSMLSGARGKAGPKGKTVAAPKGTDIVPDDPMDDA